MKRVLLMVFLMVSLGELELERYRLYLFCSAAALAGLVWNGFANRRKAHCAPSPRASEAANPECLSHRARWRCLRDWSTFSGRPPSPRNGRGKLTISEHFQTTVPHICAA